MGQDSSLGGDEKVDVKTRNASRAGRVSRATKGRVIAKQIPGTPVKHFRDERNLP